MATLHKEIGLFRHEEGRGVGRRREEKEGGGEEKEEAKQFELYAAV